MADEQADDQAGRDELEWRRQRAALHGEWDEAARYAALLGMPAPPPLDNAPPPPNPEAPAPAAHAAPVGRHCRKGYPIKARRVSMLYHPPGGAWYPRMVPDACFATEEEAQAAGYRRSRR